MVIVLNILRPIDLMLSLSDWVLCGQGYTYIPANYGNPFNG